jgi:ribosomal protein RSM22 (predicted rRNA methylase)
MELPPRLRVAIDNAIAGIPLDTLKRAGASLSSRYRAETRDGRLHLNDGEAAAAYVAARMPATYAAIREALAQLADARPDFAPASLLDVGSGPGTALWAATDAFDTIAEADCLEASAPIRDMAQRLASGVFPFAPRFIAGDATAALEAAGKADLVTLCYVLGELSPEAGAGVVDALWARTTDILLIVEPGTPAGWQRMLNARDRLISAGAWIAAPCTHDRPCPIMPPDWCHFARRLPRSRTHRLIKGGEAPFEDEKFIWLAAARSPAPRPKARVLAMPRGGSGRIDLKLCEADGAARERIVSKRDGAAYKAARRALWGDAL